MDDLIEALNIVRPYMTDYGRKYPTHCEHDTMTLNVDASQISDGDLSRLAELGFDVYGGDSLSSYVFGSC